MTRTGLKAVFLAGVLALGAAAALVLVVVPRSAHAASPSPSTSTNKVTLRIGTTADADTLNPFTMLESLSFEAMTLNYNLLFDLDLKGKARPQLAAELPTKANGGLSADEKTWIVHLRPNLKWSDGKPLTAQDVAFSFNFYAHNETASMSVGAAGIKNTVVVDPATVKIVCREPKANLEYAYLPILPEHIWKDISASTVSSGFQNKPPLVGSGPFTVVEWKRGAYLKLERNPYYWGPKPAVDEIIFSVYQNANTMKSDLQAGTIDAAQGVLPADFKSVQSLPGMTAIAYNYRSWDYLNMNCYEGSSSSGDPVLRDARFRQALNYAVDRDKIAAVAFNGLAKPGSTAMPPENWWDPDYHWQPSASELYTFDLAKAGQLLDAAGYTKNADGWRTSKGQPITLRLWTLTDNMQEQTAGKLIAGWFQQLGLKIQLSVLDTGALISRVYNYKGDTYAPDFDLYIWYWDGYSDPGTTLDTFNTNAIGSNNEGGWSNAEFDRLDVQQARTMDPEQRKTIIWEMQRLMYEQTPEIVIDYPEYLQAYNTAEWTGWTRVMNGLGPAFWAVDNQDTYVKLKPVPASAATGGSVRGLLEAAAVAVAVVGLAALAMVVRRRRYSVEEETDGR